MARRGALGVDEGQSLHSLAAVKLLNVAFKQVTQTSNSRCWLKEACQSDCTEYQPQVRMYADPPVREVPGDGTIHAIVEILSSSPCVGGCRKAMESQMMSGVDDEGLLTVRGWPGEEDARAAILSMVEFMKDCASSGKHD